MRELRHHATVPPQHKQPLARPPDAPLEQDRERERVEITQRRTTLVRRVNELHAEPPPADDRSMRFQNRGKETRVRQFRAGLLEYDGLRNRQISLLRLSEDRGLVRRLAIRLQIRKRHGDRRRQMLPAAEDRFDGRIGHRQQHANAELPDEVAHLGGVRVGIDQRIRPQTEPAHPARYPREGQPAPSRRDTDLPAGPHQGSGRREGGPLVTVREQRVHVVGELP
ncbi:MAG: hypothetical protein DMD62_13570 [Gemmatimonadetes bacterium]|nr:MAG: hypothetical protein DMD62_13570 [Gemmatimonadota bacterium]